MITGEIKNKIDQIWDTFFVAGITNPITVLEQMTYIFFMKMLDDKQLQEEENARDFDGEVQNPTFPEGQLWINPDATSDEEKAGIPYESLRWHVFKNLGADNMFKVVRQHVFEFIKHIGTGEESAYSRYMKSAIFLIPNARTLTKVIDGVDSLDMNNRDAMGDVYEYILGKMDKKCKFHLYLPAFSRSMVDFCGTGRETVKTVPLLSSEVTEMSPRNSLIIL